MTVSPIGQGKVFIINILFGILCVVLFDFFYVLRKRYGKSKAKIYFFDALYFIIVLLTVMYAGIKFNFGALRYYQLFGIAAGTGVGALFSPLNRKIIQKVYETIVKIIKVILKLVYKPVMFLLRVVLSPIYFFESIIIKWGDKAAKRYGKLKLKNKKSTKTVKKCIKMI